MKNYYETEDVAKRYVAGRPDYHQIVIDKIKDFLKPATKFPSILDIGCGNGFSTVPLLELGEQVVGVDASAAMIAQAPQHSRIRFEVCAAEALSSMQTQFGLVTVSNAFHWFDRDTFFREVRALLASDSWLIIYNNFFKGEMLDLSGFQNWFLNRYLVQFPNPSRSNFDWNEVALRNYGFRRVHFEQFDNRLAMNRQQLIAFFISQSNITAAIEKAQTDLGAVIHWLEEELEPFFQHATHSQQALFGNFIVYLQNLER